MLYSANIQEIQSIVLGFESHIVKYCQIIDVCGPMLQYRSQFETLNPRSLNQKGLISNEYFDALVGKVT